MITSMKTQHSTPNFTLDDGDDDIVNMGLPPKKV